MEYTKYKQKLAPIRNVKPYKANEKINFNTNTKNKNMTLIFKKYDLYLNLIINIK